MAVKEGDKVQVEYKGTFEDGTVFDSSEQHGEPLTFQVGAKQVIPGFEQAVVGMEEGQEKDVKLEPAKAYGDHNPEMVKKIPRDKLPEGELKAGMALLASLPNGAQMPVKIKEVDEKEVTLDMNHPLAGKTLNFHIKLVKVEAEA